MSLKSSAQTCHTVFVVDGDHGIRIDVFAYENFDLKPVHEKNIENLNEANVTTLIR